MAGQHLLSVSVSVQKQIVFFDVNALPNCRNLDECSSVADAAAASQSELLSNLSELKTGNSSFFLPSSPGTNAVLASMQTNDSITATTDHRMLRICPLLVRTGVLWNFFFVGRGTRRQHKKVESKKKQY